MIIVGWDRHAGCHVGCDIDTGIMSAGVSREHAVAATRSAVAMAQRIAASREAKP